MDEFDLFDLMHMQDNQQCNKYHNNQITIPLSKKYTDIKHESNKLLATSNKSINFYYVRFFQSIYSRARKSAHLQLALTFQMFLPQMHLLLL